MISVKRFDLEQRIIDCWGVVDDIRDVYTMHQDKRELTVDEMSNILTGLEHLYQVKFELLFDTFEQHLREAYEASLHK